MSAYPITSLSLGPWHSGWVIQALVAIGLIAGASCGLELLMDRYAKSEARGQLRGGQQQLKPAESQVGR
jgi:hypothetical protein